METSLPDEERFIAMMNMMRSTGDPAAWLEAFRTALRELFDDIDRISVDANMECKLTAPPSSTPADEAPAVQGRSGILLERLRWQQDYPFDLYHTPSVFEYLHPVSGEYLGTIILWRMSSHPPISDATLHTIEAMRPFLVFALSDLIVNVVVRQRFSTTANNRLFPEALRALFHHHDLNRHEQDVLVLLMLGFSYKGIAEQMKIALDTVRKYIRSLHAKVGVHNQLEIFRKYFSAQGSSPAITDHEMEARYFGLVGSVGGEAERQPSPPPASVGSQRILDFLNTLPVAQTSLWLLQRLNEAVHMLFGDIKVSSNFTMAFDFVRHERAAGLPHHGVTTSDGRERPPSLEVLDLLNQAGSRDADYHPPLLLDCHHAGRAIGGVVIRRPLEGEPIEPETRELVARLEPFFHFLFCDLVLRHQYHEPTLTILSHAITQVFAAPPGSTLSEAETRVLTLQFLGHPYKEIADRLGVSINTVKKHCKAINLKMGATGISDLFARHLAPILGIDDLFGNHRRRWVHKHVLDAA